MKFEKILLINLLARVFVLAMFLVGCQENQVEYSQLEYCLKHYRAESFRVAAKECKVAAVEGSAKAQWLMAHIFRYNLTNDGADPNKAFYWLTLAAEQGHVAAMREVGLAYLDANGVEEDIEKAYVWLVKAAKQSDSEAEFSIGILFFEGRGRSKDIGSAVHWFKRSAMQEHVTSINNLAWIFATSRNMAFKSPKKARFWMDKLNSIAILSPVILDTQAAVYASSDDFDKAVEFQNRAIASLPADTNEEDLIEFQKHLDRYLKGEAWSE